MNVRMLSVAAAAVLLVAASVDASVLCAKKRGSLTIRDACKAKEKPVDVASLGLLGPTGPQGPIGPEGPAGTVAVGTPLRQQLDSPGGILTDTSFTNGSMLTDVVLRRPTGVGVATCTLVDSGGLILTVLLDGTALQTIGFQTPLPVSGTLAVGCNGDQAAQVLLLGTLPAS